MTVPYLVGEYLDFSVPAYVAEGKTRLTIAIGCTGGYHRSIVIAEELAEWLRFAAVRAGLGLPSRTGARESAPGRDPLSAARPGFNLRRWLMPGIGIKRWLLVVFAGELGVALAGAFVFRQLGQGAEPGDLVSRVIWVITLQMVPGALRAALFAVTGIGLFAYGSYRVINALMAPFRTGDGEQPLVEVIYQKRFLARGPRIVAIGGGTGLSALLRGLKEHTSNLTAVVTVADDGGSSGLLRTELGVPAVGDIRNCIVALADAEPLMGPPAPVPVPGGSLGTAGRARR